jgi:hypothetical protein
MVGYSMKITDLEKFTLEQVYRPYWATLMGGDYPRLAVLTSVHNLDTAVRDLSENKEWAELVLDRIRRCEFIFPYYISHPLVDCIKEYSRQKRKSEPLVEPLEETT